MALRRGDLATVVLLESYGKPRPALVMLPITSTIVDAALLRLDIHPSLGNGLVASSQVMLNKPMTVSTDKIGTVFGHIDGSTMVSVNRSLALVSGFLDEG